MTLQTTIIFYVVIGMVIAEAAALADRRATLLERLFRIVAATLFWPLFVPLLLASKTRATDLSLPLLPVVGAPPDDAMTHSIAQVERELDLALRSLEGWPEAVLADEHDRFQELRTAWRSQATRVRELDRLLSQPQFGELVGEESSNERIAQSEQTRRENIGRLKQVRDRLRQDLDGTLSWVRELVTMIHLAKYTGAPASRAQELVSQIATAVEGLKSES